MSNEQLDRDDRDEIARRAYEISQSNERGSDDENWARAEREIGGTSEPLAKASGGDAEHMTSDD